MFDDENADYSAYDEYSKFMENNMESTIYTRIGQALESTGVIDTVLAYDAEEEQVLIQAGFIRCGSTMVNGEIVDVYKKSKERKVFKIDVGELQPGEAIEYFDKVKSYLNDRIDDTKIYYKDKLMDAAYDPLSILEDYFFPGSTPKETDKPYLTTWGRNMENKNNKK